MSRDEREAREPAKGTTAVLDIDEHTGLSLIFTQRPAPLRQSYGYGTGGTTREVYKRLLTYRYPWKQPVERRWSFALTVFRTKLVFLLPPRAPFLCVGVWWLTLSFPSRSSRRRGSRVKNEPDRGRPSRPRRKPQLLPSSSRNLSCSFQSAARGILPFRFL